MLPTTNVSKKIDFAYNFRPNYYISRVFGLMPFTIAYDLNGDIQGAKFTKFDRLYDFLRTHRIFDLNINTSISLSVDYNHQMVKLMYALSQSCIIIIHI